MVKTSDQIYCKNGEFKNIYTLNSEIALECELKAGSQYKFVGWESNGKMIKSIFKLNSNTTITAKFEVKSDTSCKENEYQIIGRIVDRETLAPIPHVVVVVGNKTAETDEKGNYMICWNGETTTIKTYAPRKVQRSDGTVVSYLSPVAGQSPIITLNGDEVKIDGGGNKWTNYYIKHVFGYENNNPQLLKDKK
jgi:hypothetical protein